MSKVLVMVTNPDFGDEGFYNGHVIGVAQDVIDCGELTEETAIEYIVDHFDEDQKEDFKDGAFELEVSSPHPYDNEYQLMIDTGGDVYHFMKL